MKFNELQFNDFGGAICLLAVRKNWRLLQQDYIGKAVMVYGKRRVGKTTLIQKALKSSRYRTVYFECLKGTMQDNISGLVQELVRAKIRRCR